MSQNIGAPPQPLRLNKAMANRGVCSRRKAEELIFSGKVKVNGKQEINPGCRIYPDDVIEVNGRQFRDAERHEYIMFNKPIQCVCTLSDPQRRTTIVDYFSGELRGKRIFPVGRLDYFSEGLLLLTTDGNFAQVMAHPSHEHKKTYEVLIRGKVLSESIKKMENGMRLGDDLLRPVKVSAKSARDGNTVLTMELSQGLNRQIRRMCAKLNLTILRLQRIKIGNLELGDLKSGQMRPLTDEEMAMLNYARN